MSINDIPGDPEGELPDKTSLGICLHCFRPYYSVDIIEMDEYIIYCCKKCGAEVKRKKNNRFK